MTTFSREKILKRILKINLRLFSFNLAGTFKQWLTTMNGKMLHAFSCQYLINVQSQKQPRKPFIAIVSCFSYWIPNNWFYNSEFFFLLRWDDDDDECVRGEFFVFIHWHNARWFHNSFNARIKYRKKTFLRYVIFKSHPELNQIEERERERERNPKISI